MFTDSYYKEMDMPVPDGKAREILKAIDQDLKELTQIIKEKDNEQGTCGSTETIQETSSETVALSE